MAAAGLSLLRFVDVATRRSFPVFVGMCSRPAGKLYRVWPHSGALRASSFVRTRSYVQQAQGDLPVSAKLAEEFTSQSPPAQTTDNAFIPDIGAEYEEINADVLEAEFSEVEEAEYADAELQDDDVADAEFEDEEVGEVKAESKSEAGAEDKDKEKDKEPEKVTITIPYVPVPEAQKAVEAMFKSSWTDMEPETKNTVISALRTRNGILLDCWDAYNDVVRFSEVFKRLTGELDEARESNTMPPDLLNEVCNQFLKYNKFLNAFDEDDADYLKKKCAGELGASMKKLQDSMNEFTKASRKAKKSKRSSDPYGFDMNDMLDDYYDKYYEDKK